MISLVDATGWGERTVLAIVFAMGLWCAALLVGKWNELRGLGLPRETDEARKLIAAGDWSALREWVKASHGLAAVALRATLGARSAKSLIERKRRHFERGLAWLAALGENAPYVGLFGAVLGITHAMGVLALAPSGTVSVTPTLVESFVAASASVLVAVPAAFGYRYFSRRAGQTIAEVEALLAFFVARRSASRLSAPA